MMLQKVVKAGSAILPHTQEKTSARHHVDTVVKGTTVCVTLSMGVLDVCQHCIHVFRANRDGRRRSSHFLG